MTTGAFFRSGAETPFVQGIKSEKYPYSVSLNSNVTPPSVSDAEILLTSAHMVSLKDRVQVDSTNPSVDIVDKFFKVELKEKAPRELALKSWGDLQWKSKAIGFGSGVVAVGLTFIALQGAPVYIIVALYTGSVASTCLAGWSLHRYHVADKELAIWQKPGEDFAKKRKTSLELSLQELIQKKCHFCPEQKIGTLLGVEMLSVFRQDFKQFATPLLARKCESPEEQHQWVSDFLKDNPFGIKFFEVNPHLANEAGWKDVQKFQLQIEQFLTVRKHIVEVYVAGFEKRQNAVKEKHEAILKSFGEKAKAHFEAKKIPFLSANNYGQRVLKVLKAECLDKIYALYQEDQKKVNAFDSLVYPQIRALLEEAQKGLLEEKPYQLDETAFAEADKFIPKNFQEELEAITALYPQNVIEKAKAEAPEEAQKYKDVYLELIDAAFQA
jgi:hypothetical protein